MKRFFTKKPVVVVSGAVFVTAIILALGILLWPNLSRFFINQTFTARNPEFVNSSLNAIYKNAIDNLNADTFTEFGDRDSSQSDLTSVFGNDLQFELNFESTVGIISEGNFNRPQRTNIGFSYEGVSTASSSDQVLIDSRFSSVFEVLGVEYNLNGDIKAQGDTFFVKLEENNIITNLLNQYEIDANKWLKYDQGLVNSKLDEYITDTDVIDEGQNNIELTDQEREDLNELIQALQDIEEPLLIDPKSEDEREILGQLTPCMSTQINPRYLDQFVDNLISTSAELRELSVEYPEAMEQLQVIIDTPVFINMCFQGMDQPMFAELEFTEAILNFNSEMAADDLVEGFSAKGKISYSLASLSEQPQIRIPQNPEQITDISALIIDTFEEQSQQLAEE